MSGWQVGLPVIMDAWSGGGASGGGGLLVEVHVGYMAARAPESHASCVGRGPHATHLNIGHLSCSITVSYCSKYLGHVYGRRVVVLCDLARLLRILILVILVRSS